MSTNEDIDDELKAQLTEPNKIGSGKFGSVYNVTKDHIKYALKEIKLTEKLNENEKKYLRELSIMEKLDNSHVVGYVKSWTTPTVIYIMMELCECDLNVLIKSMTAIFKCADNVEPNHFEFFVSYHIFHEIAQGVHYIHTQTPPIMHRDLKPPNILMASDGSLKLGDFGLAKVRDKGSMTHTVGVGNETFIAPEVSGPKPLHHHYNELCDMYSLVWRYQMIVTRKELQIE
ncbi:unnamed protein product [Oppiella nova]|uniref:non-specific serine/threonine protein kinase n=1 Tax=Oppiella nova TaxID=334625 RepID=A0A7R9LLY2_9ACAR|nr:unnamed protein product [Oppiella nova]CAG2164904.1 unnamed protein product [Oppiella nova]